MGNNRVSNRQISLALLAIFSLLAGVCWYLMVQHYDWSLSSISMPVWAKILGFATYLTTGLFAVSVVSVFAFWSE